MISEIDFWKWREDKPQHSPPPSERVRLAEGTSTETCQVGILTTSRCSPVYIHWQRSFFFFYCHVGAVDFSWANKRAFKGLWVVKIGNGKNLSKNWMHYTTRFNSTKMSCTSASVHCSRKCYLYKTKIRYILRSLNVFVISWLKHCSSVGHRCKWFTCRH